MISIIIPAYNAEKEIERCIESIINQPFKDIEILIINDGSIDDTSKIINRLAQEISCIKAIHTENQGAYNARLTGVKESRGEWIAFVDADDTITPNAFTDLYSLINDQNDIIVGTININNKRIFKHQATGLLSPQQYIEALLTYKTSIGPVAKLFRRNIFDNIPFSKIRIPVNEDLLLLLYLATHSRSIYIAKDIICYNYIFRDVSMRTAKMSIESWTLLFNLIENIIEPMNNESLEIALLELKLSRIRYQMINWGQYLNPRYELYNQVINSPYLFALSKEGQQIVRLMKSTIRQCFAHTKYSVYILCRDIINKIR
ncbi:glycosyltransferase family 2 protein [Muribaculaceae bacterium Isolate-042 (Harlan)]|uniref:glycosyltransferase family 2 protein n=1 Tax=Muribaculum intestinale TaxID=1796646 RepID=UPI000F495482|nr:glycosyltransferase family 2 protein [Muribaculum intestinale]ROS80241.1 glycosyltransferase family 2 protein [Muribaculaceae bacterium Isolate-042 (Harlan)]